MFKLRIATMYAAVGGSAFHRAVKKACGPEELDGNSEFELMGKASRLGSEPRILEIAV